MSVPIAAALQCIAIEGVDARRFAQAQFSADVDALSPGHWQWSAWLTAQGRVRALLHLADIGDGRLLALLRGGNADAILAALTAYRLRSKVMLSVETFAGVARGPMAAGIAKSEADGLVLGYGERSLWLARTLAAVASDPDANTQWRLADIRAGWPALPDGEPQFLPPALGLEHLGAVSFDKGCYPGQEIAARLHYRGGCKQRLVHLRGDATLQPGPLHINGMTAGWILDAVAGADSSAALVVVHENSQLKINKLEDVYEAISLFDP